MSLVLIPVKFKATRANGTAVTGATVRAVLTVAEADDGVVVPDNIIGTTDVNGEVTLNLWPNTRGVNGSQYIVVIQGTDLYFTGLVTVPDAPDTSWPVLLESIINQPPYPSRSAAEMAQQRSQEYMQEAKGYRDESVPAAATATTQAGIATTQAGIATVQASIATSAKVAAETARDGAQAAQRIYANTAAGIAGTTTGQYFYVVSATSTQTLELWKNNAGVAQDTGKRMVDSARFPILNTPERPSSLAPYGNRKRIPWMVADDGTVVVAAVEARELSVTSLTAIAATIASLTIAGAAFVSYVVPGFIVAFVGAARRVMGGFKTDGTFAVKALELDGTPVSAAALSLARKGGAFPYQYNFTNNMGQSLGEGSSPSSPLTTVQEYGNLGFVARDAGSGTLLPLTVANTQFASRGECPMYGALGYLKKLILKENGISYVENDYQLIACNNGYSGYTISQLKKGQAPYTLVMSQINGLKTAAMAAGKTYCFEGTIWTQGESDFASATYKADLMQLASDLNADGKATTGQPQDAILTTYQTNSLTPSGLTNVALAQLAAANESGLIYMACPTYFLSFMDTQHIDATSEKRLGSYHGLVKKRVLVDRLPWDPLQPVAHAVNGLTVDLIFNKTGLTFDTTAVPAQTNQGFTAADSGGNPVTIAAVAIVGPRKDRVRVTFSATPPAGGVINYGMIAAVGMTNFTGGAGNLRDNQGDYLPLDDTGNPLHNWCVINSYPI